MADYPQLDSDQEEDSSLSTCDCSHPRSSHNNGLFECRRCDCRGFHIEPIPDPFEALFDADDTAD